MNTDAAILIFDFNTNRHDVAKETLMFNKILGLVAGLFLAIASTGSAHAGNCSGSIYDNPCAAMWFQAGIDAAGGGVVHHHRHYTHYTPAVHQTVVTHVHVTRVTHSGGAITFYVKARQQSPLVMYVGEYSGHGAPVNVITRWSGKGWFQCGAYVCKQLSVTESNLHYGTVTICGIDGHNTFHQNDVALLVRIRHDGMGDTANMFSGGGY